MDEFPLVSVIVPTRNSELTIESCLESIKRQVYPRIEIIVVDNYSKDKTQRIAKKYGLLLLKGNERSVQRNFGATNSRGDFVFFVDSDMELTPNVVDECIKKVKEGFQAIIVPELSIGKGFWAECKALERSCYWGDETVESASFFSKEVFLKVGSYDDRLVGSEDYDLHERVKKNGYRISRIRALILHQEGNLSLTKLLRKKYYYGKTLWLYFKKHKSVAFQQFTPFKPSYFRNSKKLFKDPMHFIGLAFMRTCEYIIGFLGMLSSH